MALGDVYIYDDAMVEVTSDITAGTPSWTDVSDSVGMAKVMIEHPVAEGRHTFGRRGMRRRVSNKYTWSVDIGFAIDGYDAATTLDGIMKLLMSEPMGSSTAKRPGIRISPSSGSSPAPGASGNPQFSGEIIIHEWEPFGSGTVNEPIEEDRTYNGSGDLTRTP